MKLGFNSVLFGGHDMEMAFKYASVLGYHGLEISAIDTMSEHLVLDQWETLAPRIKSLAEQYDIPITAMEQPSQDVDTMTRAFEAACEIGIPIINCGPGGQAGSEESLAESIASLQNLAERAASYGVMLCAKAHVGAAIYNTPTTLRMLGEIDCPAFGLDMDPSHIHRAGENATEALDSVIGRIKHVHIRDCKGRQQGPGSPPMQANGRGDIDLLGFIRRLHEAEYDGPVNLEIIGAKGFNLASCVAIAGESRGHMQACLQTCAAN